VVDNQSTDDSVAVVRGFDDPRLELHENETFLPVQDNWTHAARLAQTEFVAVLHADDILRPRFLEYMVRRLQDTPQADAAVCNSGRIDGLGRPLPIRPLQRRWYRTARRWDEQDYEQLLKLMTVFPCSWLARRRLFDNLGFDSRYRCCDWDFWLKVAATPGRIVTEPHHLCDYRLHGSNDHASEASLIERLHEEVEIVEYALARKPLSPAATKQVRGMVDTRLVGYALIAAGGGKPAVARRMLLQLRRERGTRALLRGTLGLALLPDSWAKAQDAIVGRVGRRSRVPA
jgi:Glycosyl transferase family 2